MINSYIDCIEYYLPATLLSNEQLAKEHPEWSVEKISSKTGITMRHIANDDEFSSDMAVLAAEALFVKHNVKREEIDYLLFCTQSPDYFLPTTACIIQNKLGLPKSIGALDFNLGCSGFVYGLGLAKGLIETRQATNVLLITAETYSKFIHPKDKSNKTLFGDAAAATLIKARLNEERGEIGNFCYQTDGSGADYLIVKNGGMRYRTDSFKNEESDEPFIRNDNYLFMNGNEIFSFTAFNIPPLMHDTASKNQIRFEEIDLFVLHQANAFMLQTIRKRADIPVDKFYVHMADCGNTVSSTIPIALYHAIAEGRIKKGAKVLLAGFGVGLSAAATIIHF